MDPRRCCVTVLALLYACDTRKDTGAVVDTKPVVSSADVQHFISATRIMASNDTVCVALEKYLRAQTPGLAAYRRKYADEAQPIVHLLDGRIDRDGSAPAA